MNVKPLKNLKAFQAFKEDFRKSYQHFKAETISESLVTPERVKSYSSSVEEKKLQWYQQDHKTLFPLELLRGV